jgi:hypothetical protein
MRHVLPAVLLLASSVALAGPPVVTAPDKAYGEVGDWFEIKVTVEGAKAARFVPLDDSLKVFPADKLKDEFTTFVRGTEAKTYKLLVYSGNTDGPSAPAFVSVTFIGKPQPNPGPTADPATVKALKAGYLRDNAPDGRERLKALSGAMATAAKSAADPAILTNAALTARVAKDTADKVGESLHETRKEIGELLKAEFPTTVFTLTAEHRAKFAAAYTRISLACEELSR